MERSVALKKLEKLLGSKMGWRIDHKAPSPEERAAARIALVPAIDERNALKEKREKRYREILEADAEYQNLKGLLRVAQDKVDKLSGTTRRFKITVGRSLGIFFEVKAEGDSWKRLSQS